MRIYCREISFLTVSARPNMEMCGGELLLHLSPTYDITTKHMLCAVMCYEGKHNGYVILKLWKLFRSSFHIIHLMCLMQSVWSTKASFNGVRSWDDQNHNGERMLLCFYQSHGEAPHVRSLQRWKNVGLLKTTDLHCPQSSDLHRNFFQDFWRTRFLWQRM